ncbi:hypothetical protein F4X10_17390 [Candidatus Poribacteria bacterium]|nr:hypothetical protein [Candidatus Poribacteria bacterium]
MKWFSIIALSIAIVIIGNAQEVRYDVGVHVFSDENEVGERVKTLLIEELEEIGDIDVVDPTWSTYKLSVIAIETKTKDRQEKTGDVAVVCSILIAYDNSNVVSLIPEDMPELRRQVYEETTHLYQEPIMGLYNDDASSIRTICRNIVEQFNINVLKEQRREERNIFFQ